MVAETLLVLDYGSGNVRSIVNALQKSATDRQEIVLSDDPAVVSSADRLVLPGVGAFGECRRRLIESGLWDAVWPAVERGVPFLGICVGMQILAERGLEFGEHAGAGWIAGTTRRLEPDADGMQRKLPHIAWAPVTSDSVLFDGVGSDPYFYFVHSYTLDCTDPADVLATAFYGEQFTAAVMRKNVIGLQFHPEKSDHAGIGVLANFCRWDP